VLALADCGHLGQAKGRLDANASMGGDEGFLERYQTGPGDRQASQSGGRSRGGSGRGVERDAAQRRNRAGVAEGGQYLDGCAALAGIGPVEKRDKFWKRLVCAHLEGGKHGRALLGIVYHTQRSVDQLIGFGRHSCDAFLGGIGQAQTVAWSPAGPLTSPPRILTYGLASSKRSGRGSRRFRVWPKASVRPGTKENGAGLPSSRGYPCRREVHLVTLEIIPAVPRRTHELLDRLKSVWYSVNNCGEGASGHPLAVARAYRGAAGRDEPTRRAVLRSDFRDERRPRGKAEKYSVRGGSYTVAELNTVPYGY